jgi:F-type H+-transporting ATPase subunit epsilon
MKLIVTTPTEVAVDEDNVRYVRAEDSTGAFGIEPRHADFLTTLAICVMRWRDGQNTERYVAVRGGVLRVRDGNAVEVATREAVVSGELATLRGQVLGEIIRSAQVEQSARSGALRLEHAAIRQIYKYLRPMDRPIKSKPQD